MFYSGVAQLVERQVLALDVESSTLSTRSAKNPENKVKKRTIVHGAIGFFRCGPPRCALCKKAYAAHAREVHQQRMSALIAQLGGCCVYPGCARTDGLEIDHIDPKTKLFTLSDIMNRSWTVIQEEVKKCQLLCKTHHAEKTVLDRGQLPAKGTHGTVTAAKYCKPRCAACREACRIAQQKWRASRKLKMVT